MNSIDRRIARLTEKLRAEHKQTPGTWPERPVIYPPKPIEIYFLECGDWIKIGRSANANTRLTDLDNSIPYPTSFLGSFMDEPEREIRLHEQFKHLRHKGEWFWKAPELLCLIDELCGTPGEQK